SVSSILEHTAEDGKAYKTKYYNMGLTNFRGTKPRKQDVTIAKNYLNEEELSALNNLVEQYLVFAEGQAMRRIPMTMQDWIIKLDGFLGLNDREILTHAGKISHTLAKQIAEQTYDQFNQMRIKQSDMQDGDFERAIKKIPAIKDKKG
ncbi:MAG: virulence RhuM family protein, partial [Bacteroidetes bacterium]|nr:virulence RhuM family protein [Bacteroidota bacterium]